MENLDGTSYGIHNQSLKVNLEGNTNCLHNAHELQIKRNYENFILFLIKN